MEKKTKYLTYYGKSPKDKTLMRLDKISPNHKKYIVQEKWKGTNRQKFIRENILSKITYKKV